MIIEGDVQQVLTEELAWGQFSGATIVISGAGGFLPAYMIEVLLALSVQIGGNGPRIVALVRNLERARARFASYRDVDDLVLVKQDIAAPLEYDGPADYVVHAASQASPRYYRDDPVGTFNANVLGTHNLLSLALKRTCQAFLFFSSGEVYGQAPIVPTPENIYGPVDPVALRSCYAEGKRAGEAMCVAWSHQYGLHCRIARPFHTYGPGMRLDDGRVFADFVASIVAHEDLLIKSDGTARRPFCYISDACRAFFRILLTGADGVPYNVGNDQTEMSIRELADTLVTEFSERNLKVVMDPTKISDNYLQSPIVRNCPDIDRLRRLGWAPKIGVAEGFRRTITAYEEAAASCA